MLDSVVLIDNKSMAEIQGSANYNAVNNEKNDFLNSILKNNKTLQGAFF
jgi:hypothetical protein